MNKIQASLLTIAWVFFLFGCSDQEVKKVLVMASGKVQIDGNVITLEPGTTHTENVMTVTDGKVTVKTPSGSSDFNVAEEGFYLLNIKNDTVVGSYQRVGTDNSQQVISQENLRMRVDSLSQLMSGTNVNAANRNFCIFPNQLVKISNNTEAEIIGPYKRVPGSFESGKEHEIYKFYTNKEMQEIVGKLGKMMEPVKAE